MTEVGKPLTSKALVAAGRTVMPERVLDNTPALPVSATVSD